MIYFDGNLTEHFSEAEYRVGNVKYAPIYMTKDSMRQALMMEELRLLVGYPIYVNAWYRTKERNKEVGGIATSNHLRGCATDIHFDFKLTEQIAILIMKMWKRICESHGVTGEAGLYTWGLHLGQQSDAQIKTNGGKFFCWDSRSGKQINNAFSI